MSDEYLTGLLDSASAQSNTWMPLNVLLLVKLIVTGKKSSGQPDTENSMLPLLLPASITGCCQSRAPRRVSCWYSP